MRARRLRNGLVRTIRAGIDQVDRRYEMAASTLGAGPIRVFLTVTLPLARPAVVVVFIELDRLEQADDLGAHIVRRHDLKAPQRALDLRSNTVARVHGRVGVLEHHL